MLMSFGWCKQAQRHNLTLNNDFLIRNAHMHKIKVKRIVRRPSINFKFFGIPIRMHSLSVVCSLHQNKMCEKMNANNYALAIFTLRLAVDSGRLQTDLWHSSFSHFKSRNLTLSFACVGDVIQIVWMVKCPAAKQSALWRSSRNKNN